MTDPVTDDDSQRDHRPRARCARRLPACPTRLSRRRSSPRPATRSRPSGSSTCSPGSSAGRPIRLADIVDRLNATYLDWLFTVPVVADVALQLQANWMADYRNSSGIVVEDGPARRRRSRSRTRAGSIRGSSARRSARRRRVPSGWPSSAAATDRRRAADRRRDSARPIDGHDNRHRRDTDEHDGYATENALVDSEWALAHLDDPNVRFVEVDVDTTAYEQSHLPGAVGWNWTSQLADGIRRDIAGREDFSKLLSESGIGPDTTIVLYGDNNNWFAAWAYWQLKLYGHEDVRILNGGRKYWLDNGLPLSVDDAVVRPTGYELPEPDFSLRAFRDDILPRLGDPELALVDVRSPAEFNGEIIAPPGMSETAQRAGHIPGAASIPWAQTVKEDGTFKSAEDLATLYEAKGITPDKDVIAYCRIGERSSHSWFVLHELLGYNRVRNYDGSWTEYGSLIGVPIEKPAPVTAG